MAIKVIMKNVRLAFADAIWTAQQVNGQGDFKFNCAFLFPGDHPARKLVSDAIRQAANEFPKWAGKADENLKKCVADLKVCLQDGNRKDYEGYAGNYFVNASNKARPPIRDRDGKSVLVEADGRPYSGCFVNGIVDIWVQDNAFGKRVNASLMGLQFVGDGDAFSGGKTAADDDFESLEEGAQAEDSLV